MIIITGGTILFGFLAWAIIGGVVYAIKDGIDSIECWNAKRKEK